MRRFIFEDPSPVDPEPALRAVRRSDVGEGEHVRRAVDREVAAETGESRRVGGVVLRQLPVGMRTTLEADVVDDGRKRQVAVSLANRPLTFETCQRPPRRVRITR